MKDKLFSPTVGNIVAFLSALPQDKPFRIEDADTAWTIATIHVRSDDEAIWFYGKYEEMDS